MGFFEKVKNMFTEEVEEDDLKVEQIKKEVTQVAIESPNVKINKEDHEFRSFEFETEEKVSKPVFFDDNDFRDLKLDDEPKKIKAEYKENDLYRNKFDKDKLSVEKEKKIFKPTPIISPVYGILDKNYHKEDIVSRQEVRLGKESSESTIDLIRNKAYGTLEDELENTLFGTNSILFKKDEDKKEELEVKEVSDDVLTDLTDDISKELDELLIKKEKYLDIENSEEDNINDDLLGFIDSTLYKEGDDE